MTSLTGTIPSPTGEGHFTTKESTMNTITRPHLANLSKTEFGLPVLGDAPSNTDWWAQRDDLDTPEALASDVRLKASIVALLDGDAPARTIASLPPSTEDESVLREADFADDGVAYWIGALGVVSIQVDRLDVLEDAVAYLPRRETFSTPNSIGWRRTNPADFGIEIEAFDESLPGAQDAWAMLDGTVTR